MHFLTGMFVYRDCMSKLANSLFFILMCLILLRRSPEFFRCEGLIVPSRGVRILVMCFAILWGVVFMPEMIGRSGQWGLCVFGNPYIVGMVG